MVASSSAIAHGQVRCRNGPFACMIPAGQSRSGRSSGRRLLASPRGESRLTEQLIGQLGYLGIALILILGGLGLPIPEEAPIILAAVLTRNGQMHGPLALASCLVGVLLGDLVVYFLGFFYGEKVLSLPLTRRLLTRQREAQIKGYFHRHGFKILVSGRFVPGFRTAAYLTAGILEAADVEAAVDRSGGGVADHVSDVRAGLCLCPPDSKRNPRGAAVGHRDRGAWAWRSGCLFGTTRPAAAPACRSVRRCWTATMSPCRRTICAAHRFSPKPARSPSAERRRAGRPTATRAARSSPSPRGRVFGPASRRTPSAPARNRHPGAALA